MSDTIAARHAAGAAAIATGLADGAVRMQGAAGGRDDVAVLALRLRATAG